MRRRKKRDRVVCGTDGGKGESEREREGGIVCMSVISKRSCLSDGFIHTLILLGEDTHGLWWCRHLCLVGNFVICVCCCWRYVSVCVYVCMYVCEYGVILSFLKCRQSIYFLSAKKRKGKNGRIVFWWLLIYPLSFQIMDGLGTKE